MIKYDRFFKLIEEKGITQYSLISNYHISKSLFNRMRNNKNLNTHTINYLCAILDCNVEDIMEYVRDPTDLDAMQKSR